MSPQGSVIALSIIGSGFNLYDLVTGDCLRSFPVDDGSECTVPVLYAHGGHALLGGGTVGLARLWNVHNGRLHQTFATQGTEYNSCDIQ